MRSVSVLDFIFSPAVSFYCVDQLVIKQCCTPIAFEQELRVCMRVAQHSATFPPDLDAMVSTVVGVEHTRQALLLSPHAFPASLYPLSAKSSHQLRLTHLVFPVFFQLIYCVVALRSVMLMCAQIAAVRLVRWLHDVVGIIHLDLKFGHFLLNGPQRNTIVLIDFGLSHIGDVDTPLSGLGYGKCPGNICC